MTSPEISAASISTPSKAHKEVFNVVDHMINDLFGNSINTSLASRGIKQDIPPVRVRASLPHPHPFMSSNPSPACDEPMIVDNPPSSCEPGKIQARCHDHASRGNPAHRGCKRGWHGGRGKPPHHREPNSEALSVFTRFFRAEAQASMKPHTAFPAQNTKCRVPPLAEELATCKEAHAFSQQIRAKREQRYEPRTIPSTRRNPNMSLDNRNHHREHVSHSHPVRPASAASAPLADSASQVAKQVVAIATSTPMNPSSVVAPAPATSFNDADILQLIASSEQDDLSSEQDDLNREPQLRSEFLGRFLITCLLVINVLTLIAIAVASGTMQVSHNSHSLAPSPAPSA